MGSGCGGWGKSKESKGCWLQARDLRGREIHHHGKGLPSKEGYFLSLLSFYKRTHLPVTVVVQNKKELCVTVINKPRVGTRKKCVYSWYTGPHGSEQILCSESNLTLNLCKINLVARTKRKKSSSFNKFVRWSFWADMIGYQKILFTALLANTQAKGGGGVAAKTWL